MYPISDRMHIKKIFRSQGNKAYFLQIGPDQKKVPVYCHMTSSGLGACGGGGWTLVMKTDGAKVKSIWNIFSPAIKSYMSIDISPRHIPARAGEKGG